MLWMLCSRAQIWTDIQSLRCLSSILTRSFRRGRGVAVQRSHRNMTLASALLHGAALPSGTTSRKSRNLAFYSVRRLFSQGASAGCASQTRSGPQTTQCIKSSRAARLSTRAAAGATTTETAAPGDFVEVHYAGTLDNGDVFDSSRTRGEPLAFRIGAGRMIKGFDKLVTGMAVGETRKERLEPADAYGERREELTAKVPKGNAPDGLQPGMVVRLQNGMQAVVTDVTDDHVEIDANPRLAGQPLTFDVELTSLVKGDRIQKAMFGAGCFWSVELAFQREPGVLETAVGYAQGSVPDPTYEQVCSGETGHSEVVQVLYDPSQVAYDRLLDVFFDKHDPTQLNRQGGDVGTQYRSGIYFYTPEQQAAAEAAIARVNQRLSGQVVTEVEPAQVFYPAEDYHQQYLEKGGRFGQPQSAKKCCNDPIRCYG